MNEIWRGAARSLLRQRLRTGLTLGGILVGMFLVALVSVISAAGTGAVNTELEDMGLSGLSVKAADSATVLTETQLERLRSMDAVDSALPLTVKVTTSTLRGKSEETVVCGLDEGSHQVISLEVCHGRSLTRGDVRADRRVCVVDESVARAAYSRANVVGKTIELYLGGTAVPFEIVGVTRAGSSLLQNLISYIPGMVYIPYTTLQQLTGEDTFDQIAVRLRAGADSEKVGEDIPLRLAYGESGTAYTTENLAVQKERLNSILDIVTAVLTAISAVALLVSGMGILTAMMTAVGERTREIGIKKAIGATRRRILLEFLGEAVLLSSIGGLAGMAVGYGVGYAALGVLGMALPAPAVPPWWLLLFAVGTGAVFGAYPAFKAASLPPVAALRRD